MQCLFLFPRVFYFCSEVILLCCEDIVISFAVRLFFYAVSFSFSASLLLLQ